MEIVFIAYKGGVSTRQYIVVGDQKGPDFDDVGPPIFSPDGKRVAYGARKGRQLWWKVTEVQ